MPMKILPLLLFCLLSASPAAARYEKDVLESASGDPVVTFPGHASLMLEYNDRIIQSLYPYHYGETDPKLLLDQLRDLPEVEVRIRRMK